MALYLHTVAGERWATADIKVGFVAKEYIRPASSQRCYNAECTDCHAYAGDFDMFYYRSARSSLPRLFASLTRPAQP